MISSLLHTLLDISFFQAFELAFFLCLILWALLWSLESKTLQKKVDQEKYLRGFLCESLSEMNVPMAYFSHDGYPYMNEDFLAIFNIQPHEDLKEAILQRIQKQIPAETWEAFIRYLMFQSEELMCVMEQEGQSYCLHARAYDSTAYLWMSPLKNSEDDYLYAKRIINNIPIALWYRNHHSDIVYCNDVYAKILGKTAEDVIFEKTELCPPGRLGSPYKQSQKAITEKTPQTDRMHAVIDGSRRLLEVGAVPFSNKSSLGYAFDITEIEDLQKKLSKYIESSHDLLDHIASSIAIYGPDTRLHYFNRAYVNLFQFDENWLRSNPTLGDVLEDLRTRRRLPEYPNFQHYKKTRMQFFNNLIDPLQDLVHQPDGKIFRMLVAPHPLGGIFYIFDDVSEKITLERQYNTLIAVQQETIDNLFDAILVFGSDHRLQIMNRSFCKMFDVNEPLWFSGKTLQEVIDIDNPNLVMTKTELLSLFMNLFNKRHPTQDHMELTSGRILRYSYIPLPDGSHLMSFIDMTDSIRFQETLKERNRILEEVNELRSRFIHDVSYEIKTPLALIQNHTEQLQQDQHNAQSDQKQLYRTKEIIDSTKHLLSIINNMIDLSHVESGQLTCLTKKVNLGRFLKSTASLVSSKAKEKGIEIIIENNTAIETFNADEKRLKQAFFNMLSGALRAKESKGKIILRTQSEFFEEKEYLSFAIIDNTEKDHGLEKPLKIKTNLPKDTKIIKTDDLNLLKGHFTNELGLTLVKRIAQLHGGWLSVEKNEGTEKTSLPLTITTYIPIEQPSVENNECIEFLKSA